MASPITSQGGKQVLDLGSLSVSQIQQLVKNQAIQSSSGAGQPTTLLLTTGLQQLRSVRGATPGMPGLTQANIRANMAHMPPGLISQPSMPQIRPAVPIQAGVTTSKVMTSTAAPQQILLNSKLNPLLTISRPPQAMGPRGAVIMPMSAASNVQLLAPKVSPGSVSQGPTSIRVSLPLGQLNTSSPTTAPMVAPTISPTPTTGPPCIISSLP